MSEAKHTPGPWRGFATSWKSIDEMVEEHRRLLLARPDHLISYDILATDPKDPKADVVIATLGNGPTALVNGAILLASLDLLAACEEAADELDAVVAFDPGKDYGGHYNVDDAARIVKIVRAAIAKAGGGTDG